MLVGALALAGCGSSNGPTNKQQIAAIIKHEGSRPATLCNYLTDALLSNLGGKGGCLRQAASSAPDPTTRATSIRVHGSTASAVEIDRHGTHTLSFVKHKGGWKVSGVS